MFVYLSTVVKHLLGQPWTGFLVSILLSRVNAHGSALALCQMTSLSTHQLAFCDTVRLFSRYLLIITVNSFCMDCYVVSVCLLYTSDAADE